MDLGSRNVKIGLAVAIVVIAAAVAYYFYSAGSGRDDASQAGLYEEQALPDIVLGEDNAPVTIIEYASMTCPHCADFHNNTLPKIKEDYIDTGKARLILRQFPFDPRALAAAMLARCAPSERYYPMLDILFKRQVEWARAEYPAPILLQIARFAGFSQESFDECLKNQELMNNVRAVMEKAQKDYGVESTPTLFVNGEKHTGTLSAEALAKIIDDKL